MDWASKSSPELIDSVLAELADTAQKAKNDLKGILNTLDPWYDLPSSSGKGSLLTTKLASAGIDELANRAIKMRRLQGRVNQADVKKELGAELIKRFVSEERSVDRRQADRLLSWTGKRAEGRCAQFTYFYPIRFSFSKEPSEIDLGAVKLRWLSQFHVDLFSHVKAYVKQSKSDKDKQWAREHLRKASEYYKTYKWLAIVTVSGCDTKCAENAAYDLLTSALDCLHFLLGRRATNRLEIGRFKISSDVRALAWTNTKGTLVVQTSNGSLDVMGLRDGWSEYLKRPDVIESIELIKIALQAKADLSIERPLAQRFLDAARWFGEGVRDNQSFSKIVKFTTAIERLVVAGKTDDIAETVATRLADLTLESDKRSDWEDKKATVKKAYSVRSDLVHGSISPFADEVLRSVAGSGDLAEEAMYVAVHRLQKEGLLAGSLSEKQYAAWFGGVREWVESIHSRFETDNPRPT